MTQLLPGTPEKPDETTSSMDPRHQPDQTPVLITEQEVLLGSVAAAAAAPPASPPGHRSPAKIMMALGHLRIRLPEPRPVYPRRESVYFESTRMSRMMDHL